ncbi:MAG: DUF1566 domain-containing protein [Desulfobacterales bacterium]|nr:DUF1566 domain-containing protein [Desulfobacterales bacterium]
MRYINLGVLILVVVLSGCITGSEEGATSSEGSSGGGAVAIDPDATAVDAWEEGGYVVVDTGQRGCYNPSGIEITCPLAGAGLGGQDAGVDGNTPRYNANGNGTVTDLNTGLMWQQSPDTNGDGVINASDKVTQAQAETAASNLSLGGHTDWRLPTIKELYSLIDFSGIDPSGLSGNSSNFTPFIDTSVFGFAYGDETAGERVIDAQFVSSTFYVGDGAPGMGGLLFGVNFADGRIKGYGLNGPMGEKTFYLLCVRGNSEYGENDFVDHGDGTITDRATGLMWTREDSGSGMDWGEALYWVQQKNAQGHFGHSDWRLPNAKELQSLVDYARSPDTTNSAAISSLFETTAITNEGGLADYPYFWSSTTHIREAPPEGAASVYIAFGRGLGYMHGAWVDVHGAGCQRSDPKEGDASLYPQGHGPQGDAIRIDNFVRLVRDTH